MIDIKFHEFDVAKGESFHPNGISMNASYSSEAASSCDSSPFSMVFTSSGKRALRRTGSNF
ncbi:hypothetical protein DY000_02062023 [Brassica cretica]|uniref:Uncharacterized protein n=1 Tax=Brassica cretica TaxID=69181 RepID=A0ABQ7AZ01_BRACR|nr:hypothetical protein DY000_02062023 [Brassica cretica]